MNYVKSYLLMLSIILLMGCGENKKHERPIYIDAPYLQDYAIKFIFEDANIIPRKISVDRNEIVQVLASEKLYKTNNGYFQYPGNLVPDQSYIPMADMKITDLINYKNQFVYLTDKTIVSNAWAGKLLLKHNIPSANILCGGSDFDFMISDGTKLLYLKGENRLWAGKINNEKIISIKFNEAKNEFLILGKNALYSFSVKSQKLIPLYSGNDFTCFEISTKIQNIFVGTTNGYFTINFSGEQQGNRNDKLPCTKLQTISEINGNLWFGSGKGAFMLRSDGKFNYYNGKRWLPDNDVKQIVKSNNKSVFILTSKGVGEIVFKEMTLEQKAMHFEKQVRERHIRYGINANVTQLTNHNLASNVLRKADSDNLWTGMYLGSQLFRYLVTGSEEAKQNCYESFEAMERLHTINDSTGLFGRTFERRGYQEFHNEYRSYVENFWYPGYNNVTSWYHADENWDWRGSASSDQTVGQVFAMTLIAEYIDDEDWKKRAVKILDDLMTYIVENDYCLVDYNGKPSLWGRWSPEYVNRFGTNMGDRKVYSSNMIAFLQSAYKHTGKELFKEKIYELINEHNYLENLERPFSEIGPAPENADKWSKMLSEEWNHSDDEMYFLSYWALYPYALTDSLATKYKAAIKDHWEWERPEKNPLWNFCYAMTGAKEFDLNESIWTLKEWPLDMIEFAVENSHRKDIEFVEKDFWGQLTTEILPPDERPELKHNRNLFKLDAGNRGGELSAGDTFLLPYWMGRYLGVISEPQNNL